MFEEGAGAGETESAGAAGDWDDRSVIGSCKKRGSRNLVAVG